MSARGPPIAHRARIPPALLATWLTGQNQRHDERAVDVALDPRRRRAAAARDATIGSRLREVAAAVPDRVALVEGCPAPASAGVDVRRAAGRRPSGAPASAARPVRAGRARRRVGAQPAGVGACSSTAPALAGITLVTINPSFQPAEAAYVLGQSRAAGVFVVPEVRGNPLAAHAEAIRGDLAELRHVLRLDELDELVAASDGRRRRSCLPDVHAERPGTDPVHQRHDRLPEGGGAAPRRAS